MKTDVSSWAVARAAPAASVELRESLIHPLADFTTQPRQPIKRSRKESQDEISGPNELTQAAALRVLFIDDDDRVLHAVERSLEVRGFRVDCAADGDSGLVRARGGRYDVILLDLLLPKRSGIDVLRQLRLGGLWTPVVILTGRGTFDSALEAGRLGVAAYFQKPPAYDELSCAIRGIAESARLRRSRPALLFIPGIGEASRSIATLLLNLDELPPIEHALLARLLVNACATDLTFREFIAVAKSLRILHSQSDLPPLHLLAKIQGWIDEASKCRAFLLETSLSRVLAHFEVAGKDWLKVSETEVADDLGVEIDSLRHTLFAEFGVTFHSCRRAVAMRKAALELLGGNEHVRQIAFHLGYSDAANFDHAFRSFFGVTPTAFRRLP